MEAKIETLEVFRIPCPKSSALVDGEKRIAVRRSDDGVRWDVSPFGRCERQDLLNIAYAIQAALFIVEREAADAAAQQGGGA